MKNYSNEQKFSIMAILISIIGLLVITYLNPYDIYGLVGVFVLSTTLGLSSMHALHTFNLLESDNKVHIEPLKSNLSEKNILE